VTIFLTIDVETYTGDYELDVHGYGKGLDYILETLNYFGIKATFFVEALGATRWGIEPLRKVCSLIEDYGQNIQLHIHPAVAKISGIENNGDRLWKYDKAVQKLFIEIGLANLKSCGIENIQSFRAGDFAADFNTLSAMEELGLYISSNRDLDQKSSIHTKVNDYFSIKNDASTHNQILDLPITAFRSPLSILDGKYRHIEISALSFKEMKTGLTKMVKTGYSCATILTHPGEFFRLVNGKVVPIKKNCIRLEKLLKFLENRDDMKTDVICNCLPEIQLPQKSPSEIRLNLSHSIMRLFSQIFNRILIIGKNK